jgi:hypothetical protein
MLARLMGGPAPQTNKTVQLHDKMLELAQDLLLAEMAADSLFACGDGFTSKVAGRYGWYETFNGEVISFRPKSSLNFTLVWGQLVVTGDLAIIRAMTHRLGDYELSIHES